MRIRYLNFLFFCAVLSQGIGGSLEKNSKESSDIHVRKKRMIDKTPGGNRPMNIEQFPYIVNIRKNGKCNCGGSIILPEIILSAAHCTEKPAMYNILSGSSYVDKGTIHNIIKLLVHPDYNTHAYANDLALLTIDPPIDLVHSPNRIIMIYDGIIPPNTPATISGWGCIKKIGKTMMAPNELRSITVPIISNEQCRKYYHPYVEITNKDICTLDKSRQMFCGSGDSGGPLVVHGELVGVFAWSGEGLTQYNPDVFMKLSHPEYKNWIISNTSHNPFISHAIHNPFEERIEEVFNRTWFGERRRKFF